MSIYADRRFEVTHTDNGWVLEWKNDRLMDNNPAEYHYQRIMREPVKTKGIEVFTDKEQLVKRILGLL